MIRTQWSNCAQNCDKVAQKKGGSKKRNGSKIHSKM